MDSVPFGFCERVFATRKCCESEDECNCLKPLFVAATWTQTMHTPSLRISFVIAIVKNKWKYGFYNSSAYLSIDEVQKFPDLKNVRVNKIDVWNAKNNDEVPENDVVDMEKLLHFVSFLANEPLLDLVNLEERFADASHGQEILRWLTEKPFSDIYITALLRVYQRFLDAQLSRSNPPRIEVAKIYKNDTFLNDRLNSGVLRCLHSNASIWYRFPALIFERIIQNFRRDPEEYGRKRLDLQMSFSKLADESLEEMEREGVCQCEDLSESWKYTFHERSVVLTVEVFHEHSVWVILSDWSR